MKKILLAAFLACCVLLTSCSNDRVHGSGKLITQTRELSSFNKIKIFGDMNVMVTDGRPKDKAKVTTDADIMPDIITKVENNTLIIKPKGNISLKSNDVPVVSIKAKEINSVSINGNVKFNLTNLISQNFELDISGRSKAYVRGKTQNLKIKASGTTTVNTVALNADNVDIELTGAGTLKLDAKKNLNVVISGAGKVNYTGNPTVTKNITGAGKISPLN